MQVDHKAEVKALRKQLREEGSKLHESVKRQESLRKQVQSQQVQIAELQVKIREKDALKFVMETQLKRKDAQLAQVTEELAQLKARLGI